MFEHTERFYSAKRRRSTIGYMGPMGCRPDFSLGGCQRNRMRASPLALARFQFDDLIFAPAVDFLATMIGYSEAIGVPCSTQQILSFRLDWWEANRLRCKSAQHLAGAIIIVPDDFDSVFHRCDLGASSVDPRSNSRSNNAIVGGGSGRRRRAGLDHPTKVLG